VTNIVFLYGPLQASKKRRFMLVREKVQHRLTSGAWITKGSIVLTISTDLKTVSNPVIEKTVSKWYNIGKYLERKIEFRRE